MANQEHTDNSDPAKDAQELVAALTANIKELKGTPGIRVKSALRLMETDIKQAEFKPEQFANHLVEFEKQLDAAKYPANGALREAVADFKADAPAPAQVAAQAVTSPAPDPNRKPGPGAPVVIPGIVWAPDSDGAAVGRPMELLRYADTPDSMGDDIRDFLRYHTALASPHFAGLSDDRKGALNRAVNKFADKLDLAEVDRQVDTDYFATKKRSDFVRGVILGETNATDELAMDYAKRVVEAPAGEKRNAVLVAVKAEVAALPETSEKEIKRNEYLGRMVETLPEKAAHVDNDIAEFGQVKETVMHKLAGVKAGKEIETRQEITEDERERVGKYPKDGSRRPTPDMSYRQKNPPAEAPAVQYHAPTDEEKARPQSCDTKGMENIVTGEALRNALLAAKAACEAGVSGSANVDEHGGTTGSKERTGGGIKK